jgi:hypothetical protein
VVETGTSWKLSRVILYWGIAGRSLPECSISQKSIDEHCNKVEELGWNMFC